MDYTNLIADLNTIQQLQKQMLAARKSVFDQLRQLPWEDQMGSATRVCKAKVERGYGSDLTAGKLKQLLQEVKQLQS